MPRATLSAVTRRCALPAAWSVRSHASDKRTHCLRFAVADAIACVSYRWTNSDGRHVPPTRALCHLERTFAVT